MPSRCAHSWSLTRGSTATALVRCGLRSWAIRPILYFPTGTRPCGPSRWVYSPALAWSSRTSPLGSSVQMRAKAPCARGEVVSHARAVTISQDGGMMNLPSSCPMT